MLRTVSNLRTYTRLKTGNAYPEKLKRIRTGNPANVRIIPDATFYVFERK